MVYRYFLHSWPQLAFLAYDGDHCFGTVVCKMDVHREQMLRGYLAMLVVEKPYRSLGTGKRVLLHQSAPLCCIVWLLLHAHNKLKPNGSIHAQLSTKL